MRIAKFVPDKINSDCNPANELEVRIINQKLDLNIEVANSEICGSLNHTIEHSKIKYCNNILEYDHRRIKTITDPMKWFKGFGSAVNTIAVI